MNRIWFDTEFIEDGKTIDLISIGMVRGDGETLYLENSECDLTKATPWVVENVVPHLAGVAVSAPRWKIAKLVRSFVGLRPEFWAYYADYDWVVLCQLYGTMTEIPTGWPHFCMDLKQFAMHCGHPITDDGRPDAHNALADAMWCKAEFERIMSTVK